MAKLAQYHPVIQSDREIIELNVVEWQSDADHIDAFLVPAKEMSPNTRYNLKLTSPPNQDECLQDSTEHFWEIFSLDPNEQAQHWLTTSSKDSEAPMWSSPPVVVDAETRAGGHTWASISIKMPVSEDTEFAVFEIAKSDGHVKKEIRTLINKGHSSCSGKPAFSVSETIYFGCDNCDVHECSPGERYRVWITAMDLAGNQTRAPMPVEFRIPDPPLPPRYELEFRMKPPIEMLSKMEVKTSESGLKARIEGTVELSVLIRPDGTVQDVNVTKGLPMGLADLAAESVRKWLFIPQDGAAARRIGVSIKYKTVYPPYEPNWTP